MIKRLPLLLTLVLLSTSSISQVRKCFSDRATKNYYCNNVNLKEIHRQNEASVQQWIAANKDQIQMRNGSAVVTIPVVIHVVYKNAAQNIADSNLWRQVDILNECYRLMNPNFGQTRPIFDSIAADVEIEFCLASVDPDGNPTDGITRTAAGAGALFDPILGFDNVKAAASGGKDPWPADQYLNIWVCDMSFLGLTVFLGYATFPGGDPLVDGVVIQYDFIGYMPNGTTSDEGKTAVHEVGHWLGLRHIWGDGQGSAALCDSTDYVDDTPNADTASQQTCIIKNSCSNESAYWTSAGIDPPDMIENYMDYSYDACMTMFTEGQKTRMLGFLNTVRSGILTSQGCNTVGLNDPVSLMQISVFPNPTKGLLELRSGYTGKFEFHLSDLTGRTIKTYQINQSITTLDISEFASGILFYEIVKEGRSMKSGKIIKVD